MGYNLLMLKTQAWFSKGEMWAVKDRPVRALPERLNVCIVFIGAVWRKKCSFKHRPGGAGETT